MASETATLTRREAEAAEHERAESPSTPDAEAPAPAVEVPEVRGRLRSGMLAGLFTLAIFYTFYFAKAVLIPIALAMLLNLLLAPVVRGLKRYLRLPAGVGAALVLLVVVAAVAGSIYGLSGPATRWVNELPIAMINLRLKLEELREPVAEVQEAAQKVENLAEGAPGPSRWRSRSRALGSPRRSSAARSASSPERW